MLTLLYKHRNVTVQISKQFVLSDLILIVNDRLHRQILDNVRRYGSMCQAPDDLHEELDVLGVNYRA